MLNVSPLRLPVKVFSGIHPPAALLEAMQVKAPPKPPRPASDAAPAYEPTPAGPGSSYMSPTEGKPHGASSTSASASIDLPAPSYDEAPPSYEDAIASDLPPVDGPRPHYDPPPAPPGEDGIGARDEKRGFGF
jgi:hypothetical protein